MFRDFSIGSEGPLHVTPQKSVGCQEGTYCGLVICKKSPLQAIIDLRVSVQNAPALAGVAGVHGSSRTFGFQKCYSESGHSCLLPQML